MIANVLTQIGVEALNKTFSYNIPDNLLNKVQIGSRVIIPFGPQKLEGFVISIEDSSNKTFEYKLKNIIDVVDEFPVLNEELLNLGKYISKTTFCTLINAYQVMLPTALKAKENTNIKIKTKSYLTLNKSKEEIELYIQNNSRAKKQIELLNCLLNTPKIEKSIFEYNVTKTLKDKGLIKIIEEQLKVKIC